MNHIVKRAGHTESYDERKLYASVYAACLSVRTPVGSAELIAERIVKHVGVWLANKHEVTSNDIRRTSAKYLHAYAPEASFLYLHHRVVW